MGDDQPKQRRVIADANILTALELAFDAKEFTGEHIVGGERLFVYAHSLVEGATQRTQHAGLKMLQQLLVEPLSEPAAVTVLGMTPPSTYGRFSYLFGEDSPVSYLQLPTTLPVTDKDVAPDDEWQQISKQASEEELELQCSTFRHSLQSVMAATRIYLGAAIAGHVDASHTDFSASLGKLQVLVDQLDPTTSIHLKEVIEGCIRHQKRFSKTYPEIYKPTEIDLWVLDDHWVAHGWKLVFEALPFRSVRGFTRLEDLESAMANDPSRPTTLMVDCNLGEAEDIPTGLELLNSIRSYWQDVRIIFSTAYDDAALALTSLREGANAFFAKELNDAGDRRSLDYYRQFTNLLRPHPIELQISSLWQTFSTKDTLKNFKTNDPDLQPPVTLDMMLRLGFFLLFSFIDDANHWGGNKLATSEGHLYRAVVNLVASGYPKLRAPKTKLRPAAGKIIRKAAHGGEICFNEMHLVLEGVLAILQDKLSTSTIQLRKQSPQPAFWPYEMKALKTDSTYPGVSKSAPLMTHDIADGQGAIELMRGVCCDSQCEKNHEAFSVLDIINAHSVNSRADSYSGLLLIDDAGKQTQWFDAFQSIFPTSKVFTNVDDALNALNKTEPVNLIVLDLKLPSFEAGHRALARILHRDPSVPVITTSASWHALEAIRSLRKGAIDFIGKTVPCTRDLPACVEFANEYKKKCELLLRYGDSYCRKVWKLVHALRHNTKRDKVRLAEARHRIARCQAHQSKQKNPEEWQVPPDPSKWNSLAASELGLLLRLRQQIFFIQDQDLILSLDNWRWEHVLCSKSEVEIAKLIAILAGNIVERMAIWKWCLDNGQALESRRWGIPDDQKLMRGDEIGITAQITKLGASGAAAAWHHRSVVLHADRQTQSPWNADLCDKLIEWAFKSVTVFGKGTMYS